MFLAKHFETSTLSDGCGVKLLQRVNYVTQQFLNKINVIKVVKVILELFKLDNHLCIIQELFIPYINLCFYKLYGPIVM